MLAYFNVVFPPHNPGSSICMKAIGDNLKHIIFESFHFTGGVSLGISTTANVNSVLRVSTDGTDYKNEKWN